MRTGKLATLVLIALCLGGALWANAGSAEPKAIEGATALTAYAEAALANNAEAGTGSANMSAWIKTAQSRCPPGQLVFLTNACGCNGACCACSAQAAYLDHCSCRCSPNPPTTCNRGFSAGRR